MEISRARVLGVDTAIRHTGYGVIEAFPDHFKALDCGVIANSATLPHSECLRRLAGGLRQLIELYHPDCAAIEGAFFGKNIKTTLILGYARGCVMTVLAEAGIPAYAYSPREVKRGAVGTGAASKSQVASMVGNILNLDIEGVADDATDALALALCHAQRALRQGSESFLGKPV